MTLMNWMPLMLGTTVLSLNDSILIQSPLPGRARYIDMSDTTHFIKGKSQRCRQRTLCLTIIWLIKNMDSLYFPPFLPCTFAGNKINCCYYPLPNASCGESCDGVLSTDATRVSKSILLLFVNPEFSLLAVSNSNIIIFGCIHYFPDTKISAWRRFQKSHPNQCSTFLL